MRRIEGLEHSTPAILRVSCSPPRARQDGTQDAEAALRGAEDLLGGLARHVQTNQPSARRHGEQR